MKTIDDAEKELLKGVKVLVVNGLRWEKEHHSHQLINEAIAFSKSIGAEKTFLTHVTHEIGVHVEASNDYQIMCILLMMDLNLRCSFILLTTFSKYIL